MDKYTARLTNGDIAEIMAQLPDNDFYDVLLRIAELHEQNEVTMLEWYFDVITEIQEVQADDER